MHSALLIISQHKFPAKKDKAPKGALSNHYERRTTLVNSQGRDRGCGVIAVAGLQGTGGQRVEVTTCDRRGYLRRHGTGAVGRDGAAG